MGDQRLFISHASADTAIIDRIVAYLESNGVACWVAHRDIPPRSIYAESITQALRDCSACAVVLSRTANESDAIKRELELASHYRKPFIPIRVDDTEPGAGVDYYLRNAQWVDYRRDGEHALDRIAAHVKGVAPPEPPLRRGSAAMRLIALVGVIAIVAATLLWPRGTNLMAAKDADGSQTPISADAPTELIVGYWSGNIACGDRSGGACAVPEDYNEPVSPNGCPLAYQGDIAFRATESGALIDDSGVVTGRWSWSPAGFRLRLERASQGGRAMPSWMLPSEQSVRFDNATLITQGECWVRMERR